MRKNKQQCDKAAGTRRPLALPWLMCQVDKLVRLVAVLAVPAPGTSRDPHAHLHLPWPRPTVGGLSRPLLSACKNPIKSLHPLPQSYHMGLLTYSSEATCHLVPSPVTCHALAPCQERESLQLPFISGYFSMRESRGWEKLMDIKACVTVSLEISLLRHFPLLLSRFFSARNRKLLWFFLIFFSGWFFVLLIRASEICGL